MTFPMFAAYVRVSSRSQNLKTQREAITRAAAARGWVIERWFEEKTSGAKLARPELDKVRELARTGEITRLFVFRLDRLTRSGIRDTLGVLEELQSYGCNVVSVADGFELDGPAAEIVIAVMAWAAKMERLAIGERISAARARVERAGGKWGRPSRVAPELASKIQSAKGTVRELAVRFHVPRSTVANVLSKKGAYARTLKPAAKRRAKKR
jgi:DNA invertase Pin-like site-specific DNA recombinase